MDDLKNRYYLRSADHGREIWIFCKACVDPIKAYSQAGMLVDLSTIELEIGRHEKKVHTERTVFDVYGINTLDVSDPKMSLKVHVQSVCSGEFCVIHKPSMHHMRFWPTVFDPDRYFLALRVCEHGSFHPDPDSVAHFKSMTTNNPEHECCPETCCIEED